MKHSKLITQLVAVVITVLAGVAIAAANNWTPPITTPPSGNADAPINTGNTAQIKSGGLVLGNGLAAGVPALVIPKGDFLLGTTVGQAAPNGGSGNIVANDLYITSVGKWASTLTAAAPPTTCTPTDWSPAVNAADVCTGTVATQVKTNADCSTSAQPVAGTKDCTGSPYTPGEWFTDKLTINYIQSDPDGSWATKQEKSFIAPHALSKFRLRGYTDDGGYCYVYWGTGHMQAVRLSTSSGFYTEDGLSYPRSVGATPGAQTAPLFSRSSGDYCVGNSVLITPARGSNYCQEYTCPVGATIGSSGGLGGGYVCNIATPATTFDDSGSAKVVQAAFNAGSLTTLVQDVTIPEGATVTLQGRHTIGAGSDGVNCGLDIQYAP